MKYFTITELTSSETAQRLKIDNTPTAAVVKNLETLVDKVLDPARERLGMPIVVTSGYRCQKLNRLVGGVGNSQHLTGQAADLVCKDIERLWQVLATMDFDQLIWERGGAWIHVSFIGKGNRHQIIGRR